MKTERVTLLTTPEFKAFLVAEALHEGVSVAELVRVRCEQREGADAVALRTLARELSQSVNRAQQALRGGIEEADSVLKALRAARAPRAATVAAPAPARAKAKVKAAAS